MIFHCVVREYHTDGAVYAWITNHAGRLLSENRVTEYSNKKVFQDYFTDKGAAIAFCDQAELPEPGREEEKEMHKLTIDSKEKILLDGKELDCVTGYELKHSAGQPAELKLTLLVTVGQVASELKQ